MPMRRRASRWGAQRNGPTSAARARRRCRARARAAARLRPRTRDGLHLPPRRPQRPRRRGPRAPRLRAPLQPGGRRRPLGGRGRPGDGAVLNTVPGTFLQTRNTLRYRELGGMCLAPCAQRTCVSRTACSEAHSVHPRQPPTAAPRHRRRFHSPYPSDARDGPAPRLPPPRLTIGGPRSSRFESRRGDG